MDDMKQQKSVTCQEETVNYSFDSNASHVQRTFCSVRKQTKTPTSLNILTTESTAHARTKRCQCVTRWTHVAKVEKDSAVEDSVFSLWSLGGKCTSAASLPREEPRCGSQLHFQSPRSFKIEPIEWVYCFILRSLPRETLSRVLISV